GRTPTGRVLIAAGARTPPGGPARPLDLHAPAGAQPDPAGLALGRRGHHRAFVLVVRIHRADDVGGPHLAAADRREHVVGRGAREPCERTCELLVGILALGPRAQALDDSTAVTCLYPVPPP